MANAMTTSDDARKEKLTNAGEIRTHVLVASFQNSLL